MFPFLPAHLFLICTGIGIRYNFKEKGFGRFIARLIRIMGQFGPYCRVDRGGFPYTMWSLTLRNVYITTPGHPPIPSLSADIRVPIHALLYSCVKGRGLGWGKGGGGGAPFDRVLYVSTVPSILPTVSSRDKGSAL